MELKTIPSSPEYSAGDDGEIYRTAPRRAGRHMNVPLPAKMSVFDINGSRAVRITSRKKSGPSLVGRLVAEAWTGKVVVGQKVYFRDGDNQNTRPDNISWEKP